MGKYDYQAVKKTISANSTQKLFGPNAARSIDFQNQDATNTIDVWFGLNPWYLDFDGTNDVVNFGSTIAGTLDNAASGRIHMGVLIDSAGTGARTLFSISDADAETAFWLKVDTNGKLEASLVVGGTASWTWTSTSALPTDEWLELSVIHDGVAPTFSLNDDGQLPGSFSVTTDKTDWLSALTTVDTVGLGALDYNSAGDADFFNGGIDFIKIYSGANTLTSPLTRVFWAKIDEGTGNTIDDEESANNGTNSGATWTVKQGIQVGTSSARIFHIEDDPGFRDGVWCTNAAGAGVVVVGKKGKLAR